jgi:FMN reductase
MTWHLDRVQPLKAAVVVGNPKPRSRTLDAGILAARMLTGAEPHTIVDVVELGAALLALGDASVAESISAVQGCDLVVFASPTFKATYTGLLKLYLDQVPQGGLSGIVALPLMLGAGPAHALAPDLLLKPVLVELGATCPMRGLYLLDSSFATDGKLETWAVEARALFGEPACLAPIDRAADNQEERNSP